MPLLNQYDRYAILRVSKTLLLMVGFLILIFILIDFSENSDDFTDRGAPMEAIWQDYYFNYIPEMTRLITPVALFLSILLVVGQMTQRLEIMALKAAGVSMYRLALPFIFVSLLSAAGISLLDSKWVPQSNKARAAFEKKYIKNSKNRQLEYTRIYRQENKDAMLSISAYEGSRNTGYTIKFFKFKQNKELLYTLDARRMRWVEEDTLWNFQDITRRDYHAQGYTEIEISQMDTVLNIFPRDIARTSSDIYHLSYQEAFGYVSALQRSGAEGVEEPLVQLYGRLLYPLGCLIVSIIGFSISTRRLRGGKGLLLGLGLFISFMYLAVMKISEPLGSNGKVEPLLAVSIPHILFAVIGIGLLIGSRK